jgi:hypothetical protein
MLGSVPQGLLLIGLRRLHQWIVGYLAKMRYTPLPCTNGYVLDKKSTCLAWHTTDAPLELVSPILNNVHVHPLAGIHRFFPETIVF